MKYLIDENGEYTAEAAALIEETVDSFKPIFCEYMERGFNAFEILGIMDSALVNAQRQAWIEEKSKKND